jgi:hypothetical protein
MRVGYEIHYYIKYSCEGNTLYDKSDFPEDKEEFDEMMLLRKSEGWESIGHISRDGLRMEVLFMDVQK